MQILIGLLIFSIMVGAFFICYTANKRTILPEGMDVSDIECGGCNNFRCSRNKNAKKAEEIQ